MGSGRGSLESLRRASRTLFFMLFMLGSLMVSSAPLLVSVTDIITPCIVLSTFTCCATCFGFKSDWAAYGFRTSLLDIPFLSLVRSLAIFCAYSVCGLPSYTYGPYFGMAAICGLLSTILLVVKAFLFTLSSDFNQHPASVPASLHVRHGWGMPSLCLSSMALALGHIVVAYRTKCRASGKLHLSRLDRETVLLCKAALDRWQKYPHSVSSSFSAKANKATGNFPSDDEWDLPAPMLADKDSLFMLCKGLFIHHKICGGSPVSSKFDGLVLSKVARAEQSHCGTGKNDTHLPILSDKKLTSGTPSDSTSLYAPFLGCSIPDNSTYCFVDLRPQTPHLMDWSPVGRMDSISDGCPPKLGYIGSKPGKEATSSKGVVLIHGFGGGVFSWRHVMHPLAAQLGCMVVAFDRPGWGLTSRPDRTDWEKKGMSNPYELHSQVDFLLEFCRELKLTSVVLVGHDDGGLLALMAAVRCQTQKQTEVEVQGVVLVGVSLSRDVVPAFARVLLHTSLGRHMLRPLLRSEIGQVANRRAWHDASKLTPDVLELYKAPLRVEGWEKALAEVSKASSGGILSSSNAGELLKSVQGLPALVIAGVQDILVPLRSAQALAVQLPCSRLVTIPSCGHLPHEETPGALLAALIPFVFWLQTDRISVLSIPDEQRTLLDFYS